MALFTAPHVPQSATTPPPRFFAGMAPGWALYAMTLFVTSALTGLAGWMMQNGLRRAWTLLLVVGLGGTSGGLALLWQRRAWRTRVRQTLATPAPAAPTLVTRTDRRAGRVARGLLLTGVVLFTGGLIGIIQTRKLPTLP